MVMKDVDRTQKSDRGQLVLIGALALAFILLGVVVVFNGVQYTETVSSGEASESTEDVRITSAEMERGIAGMLDHSDIDESTDTNTVEAYIEDYAEIYAESRAQERPVSTTIEVEVNSVELDGSEIVIEIERIELHYISDGVSASASITADEIRIPD